MEAYDNIMHELSLIEGPEVEFGPLGFSCNYYNNNCILFGGLIEEESTNRILKYDLKKKDFITIEAVGEIDPRYDHSSCILRNLLVVFGGSITETILSDNVIWSLDLTNYQWGQIKCTKIPSKRTGHSYSVLDNTMFLFGGYNGTDYLSDLWAFIMVNDIGNFMKLDTQNNPPRRSGHSMSVYKSKLLIFGGFDGISCYNDLWAYNTEDDNWISLSHKGDVPLERSGHQAFVFCDKLYIIGGRNILGQDLNDLWCYQLGAKKWVLISSNVLDTKLGLFGHKVIIQDNKLYVFGGIHDKSQFVVSMLVSLDNNSFITRKSDEKDKEPDAIQLDKSKKNDGNMNKKCSRNSTKEISIMQSVIKMSRESSRNSLRDQKMGLESSKNPKDRKISIESSRISINGRKMSNESSKSSLKEQIVNSPKLSRDNSRLNKIQEFDKSSPNNLNDYSMQSTSEKLDESSLLSLDDNEFMKPQAQIFSSSRRNSNFLLSNDKLVISVKNLRKYINDICETAVNDLSEAYDLYENALNDVRYLKIKIKAAKNPNERKLLELEEDRVDLLEQKLIGLKGQTIISNKSRMAYLRIIEQYKKQVEDYEEKIQLIQTPNNQGPDGRKIDELQNKLKIKEKEIKNIGLDLHLLNSTKSTIEKSLSINTKALSASKLRNHELESILKLPTPIKPDQIDYKKLYEKAREELKQIKHITDPINGVNDSLLSELNEAHTLIKHKNQIIKEMEQPRPQKGNKIDNSEYQLLAESNKATTLDYLRLQKHFHQVMQHLILEESKNIEKSAQNQALTIEINSYQSNSKTSHIGLGELPNADELDNLQSLLKSKANYAAIKKLTDIKNVGIKAGEYDYKPYENYKSPNESTSVDINSTSIFLLQPAANQKHTLRTLHAVDQLEEELSRLESFINQPH